MKKKYLAAALLTAAVLLVLGAVLALGGWKNKGIVVTQYADASGRQAMFYTLEAEGKLYLVDGGWAENADAVRAVIREKGGRVDGWILTHPHPDHIGAFNEIYCLPESITIGQIYTVAMDYGQYRDYAQEWDDFGVFDEFCVLTGEADNLTFLKEGDCLEFPGMKLDVLSAYDSAIINYSSDLANQGSLVFKVQGKTQSMLFCSDVYGEALCDKIAADYREKLPSTYLQMGHHGNNSVTYEFIGLAAPQEVFFDAPQWLVDGEAYDTKQNMEYVQGLGAKVYTYSTAPNRIVIR